MSDDKPTNKIICWSASILALLTVILGVSVEMRSRQGLLRDDSTGGVSEDSAVSTGSAHKVAPNRRSVGERIINVPALNRSKLAAQNGEIGIVRISAATMNHLINQQPRKEMDQLISIAGSGVVELFTVDQLVDLLGEQGLGRSIVSKEDSEVSLHGSGWGTKVNAMSEDEHTNLSIVTNDGSRTISSTISICKGFVAVMPLGNSAQGDSNGGLIYLIGGMHDRKDAAQTADGGL